MLLVLKKEKDSMKEALFLGVFTQLYRDFSGSLMSFLWEMTLSRWLFFPEMDSLLYFAASVGV